MYICVTHVDAATKKPCYIEHMRHGPTFPEVKGFVLEWYDISRYPIVFPDFPKFYGTCDDDADVTIPGVIEVLSEENYNLLHRQEINCRYPFTAVPSQLRLAMIKKNVYNDFLSAIDNMQEPFKSAFATEFEFSLKIDRTDKAFKKVTDSLGWSEDFVRELFSLALGISMETFMEEEPS